MTNEPGYDDRRRSWLALGVGLLALAILLSLGTWQAGRLLWKQNLQAKIHDMISSEPGTLADAEVYLSKSGDVDYLPVTLAGRYLHDRESHFLATWKGEAGFFVYTPLQLSDGRYILVNRGFVPYEKKDPATRPTGQVEGDIAITGLARDRLTAKPGSLVPDNDPGKNVFYWKDLDAMAAHAGLDRAAVLPFFIDANDAPNPGGLPIGGVTMLDLPNNHLQYAITWYGLAVALFAVIVAWLWRARNFGALLVFAVLTLVLVLAQVAFRAAGAMNHKIDRCEDQTSSEYIWDDARRAAECQ